MKSKNFSLAENIFFFALLSLKSRATDGKRGVGGKDISLKGEKKGSRRYDRECRAATKAKIFNLLFSEDATVESERRQKVF
jgi:hypothetical protein